MENELDPRSVMLLQGLSGRQKETALTLYGSRAKKTWLAYVLMFVFVLYYFYLGKPIRNIILWILCTILIGWVWWFIDLFRLPGLVRDRNVEIMARCVQEAELLYPDRPEPKRVDGYTIDNE